MTGKGAVAAPPCVAVLGAAGRTGSRVVAQAVAAGLAVRGLVRRPQQAEALRRLGADAVLGDLTGEWEAVLDGAGAVVWAAGAGASRQYDRIDRDALIAVVRRLEAGGPGRLVVVSSKSAGHPEAGPEPLRPALRAKHASDAAVMSSRLQWTVIRPGGLTDDPGTGRVQAAFAGLPRGMVSRSDVAAAAVACVQRPDTAGLVFELLAGQTPLETALTGLTAQRPGPAGHGG